MKTMERGSLSSMTTSKSIRPTLQPTRTTGNLPPTEGRPAQAKEGVPRSTAGGPFSPPRIQVAGWLLFERRPVLARERPNTPSYSLLSETMGTNSQPPLLKERKGREGSAPENNMASKWSCAEQAHPQAISALPSVGLWLRGSSGTFLGVMDPAG